MNQKSLWQSYKLSDLELHCKTKLLQSELIYRHKRSLLVSYFERVRCGAGRRRLGRWSSFCVSLRTGT